MGVIEAIRKGFGVATKSMGLVLVLFLFNWIGNLLSIPFAPMTPAAGAPAVIPPAMAAPALLFSIAFILVSIFIQGGTLGLVRDSFKEGKMRLSVMPQYGAKYYLRLLGVGVLIVLILAIVAVIAGIIVAVTAPLNNAVVTGIAIVIALIIVVAAALKIFIPLTLSPYAVVCEEKGVVSSMKRSLQLMKKPISRVFVLILLILALVLIALAIGFVVGLLVGLVSVLLPMQAGRILMITVSSAVNGYMGLVVTASFMAYFLKITKETL
ncbi:MAG: hypothetical protein NC938_07315 [Candidatus Omnitrophica bacterium]|nr:hypothetical protein [Candidatus Omnitrophota bacterium]